MSSKVTAHGSQKGDFLAARGRNCRPRIHRSCENSNAPVYRKFDGKIFRLMTIQSSIRQANYFIEEYRENFFVRKVRFQEKPGVNYYAIYVRNKKARRGGNP